MPGAGPITLLLQQLKNGDRAVLNDLVPLVYPELKRMTASYLRTERRDHTLQPIALVHEAYLRLAGPSQLDLSSRAHFFGLASQIMRQVLVDLARRKKSAKRSLPGARITFNLSMHALNAGEEWIIRIADAIDALSQLDPRQAKLIEMRFFGGLTAEESAEALDTPVQTVRRQLRVAQAWLHRELERDVQK
ncbi:MAG: sigma-70 family RNA polymerase sigma factor [Bryobacterales bacterium]|nr:sigma-70 family RNA polymerase sigma factor [Bryobacterales bacterium]